MQQFGLEQTIGEIKYLIETSQGDTGRLSHILETIKNKKPLEIRWFFVIFLSMIYYIQL